MIYRILYNHQEIYGPDLDMAVLNPTLEVELNAAGKLEFTLPITREGGEDPIWNNIQVFQGEVEVYEGDDCIWFGRPLQIIRDWNNHKRVLCEGALAYFNDTVQRTKEYKQNEQGVKDTPLYTGEPYTASKYKKGFFNALIDNHNSQVQKESGTSTPDTNRLIEVGTVDVDNELVWRKTDYETTAECLQSMCLDTNGGYFILRKEKVPGTISDYVSKIDWRREMPYGTDQPVAFGLNLLDISQDLNGADLCTVLIPTGEDDMNLIEYRTVDEHDERYRGCTHVKGDDYIVHTAGFAKYGKILKQKTFNGSSDEIATRGDLFNKATDWLNEQNTDETTIECSAADLHYLNEYSDYGKLRIGQMVTVIDSVHNVNRTLPIFKVSMNLDSGVKQITMGTPPKKELTDIVKPKTSSSTRGSNGGNADSTGDSGGSGGSGGGSASVPVKDVQTKVPGGSYHSVVEKKKAKIDLSGYVTDITMDGGSSIVNRETGAANIQVPVKGVEVDDVSIVDASGIAKINSNNFGKVDDVRVDGNSVVANKIANINSNNFGKVDDVQVNGTSIVDANKIARLTGFVDGALVTFDYLHHEYYWVKDIVIPSGEYWHIVNADKKDYINAVYNADSKSLRFDLTGKFQRPITWGPGLKEIFANLGPDPAYHDTTDRVDGNYIAYANFHYDHFLVNDSEILLNDIADYELENDTYFKNFKLNFRAGAGIEINATYDSNLLTDTEGFDIKISSSEAKAKPHCEEIFHDYATDYPDGTDTEVVKYTTTESGTYAIVFTSSFTRTQSITFEDGEGNTVTPSHIYYNNSFYFSIPDAGTNGETIVIVCDLDAGVEINFNRRKSSDFKENRVLRAITLISNIAIDSTDPVLDQGSTRETLTRNESSNGWTIRSDRYSDIGSVNIAGSIAFDYTTESDPGVHVQTTAKTTHYHLYPEYNRDYDPFSLTTYNRVDSSSIDASVAYDNGPIGGSQHQEDTTRAACDSFYCSTSGLSGNNDKAYVFQFYVTLKASKYDDSDDGYVTEAEMEDAISDAVSTLESNFQDGVDAIYDACVAKGSTPASQSLSDVVQGIMDIPQGGGSGDTVSYSSSTQEAPLNVELVVTTWTVTNMSFSSEVIV